MKWITIALASSLIALAGCSQVSPTEPATDPSSAGPAPNSEPTTTEVEPTTSEAPEATTSDTSSEAGDAGACRTADLEIAVGEPDGAAGSIYLPLTFTLTAPGPCLLDGSPEVIFVDDQRQPIGDPAEPDGTGEPVTLAPGETATASLQIGRADIYDGCEPVESTHMLVTPTGSTEPIELAAQFSICTGVANTHIGLIEGPVAP